MIRIKNFNVPFNDQSPINDLVAKRLKLPPQHIDEVVIVRKGIDARRYKGAPIYFVYILDVKVNIAENKVLARLKKDKNIEIVTTISLRFCQYYKKIEAYFVLNLKS